MSTIKEFNDYRQRMNDVILSHDNKVIKRFFSLDGQTYENGSHNGAKIIDVSNTSGMRQGRYAGSPLRVKSPYC